MVKVRVFRKQNRYYVELPENLTPNGEMELFELRDGYFLLTNSLDPSPTEKTEDKSLLPTEQEKQVLQKLLSIRFNQRTPDTVSKTFTTEEKNLLAQMEKKKFINIYKGKKYKNGVYNIHNKIYPLLRQPQTKTNSTTSSSELNNKGYMIIKDKREAYTLSEKLKKEMKAGSVKGVKGFDNTFYVVTAPYYAKASAAILGVLKEDMTVDSIASKTKMESEACRAVLTLLAENGEVIERKKNTFTMV